MDALMLQIAGKIPAAVRKVLLEGGHIDAAVNTETRNTSMEFIFDVYEEFIDVTGAHDDWTCYLCREHVLKEMRRLKPYIEKLQETKQ